MNELFLGTSAWASWADRSPIHHLQAVAALDLAWNSGTVAVTTNWVLVELTALMTSTLRIPKPDQIRFFDDLLHHPTVLVIPFDPELERAAWAF